MYVICLATDYDGTLAHDGVVDSDTVDALVRLKRSGRKLVLVTGRELPDLVEVCPRLDLFDRVVVENGALLFDPATKQERSLGPEPSLDVRRSPEGEGRRAAVGRALDRRHLGAERNRGAGGHPRARARIPDHFNKGAVMVLAAGINKASGLAAALDDLGALGA